MHPIFRRPTRLTAFIFAAAAWGALLAAALQHFTPGSFAGALAISVPLAVVFSFQSLAVLYPARTMPLDTTPVARLMATHALIGAVSICFWLALGWLWSSTLGAADRFLAAILLFAGTGALLHAASLLAHYLLIAIERSREAERQAFEARLLARGAELRLLRAQLNPHFLFNSLNSISALAGSDPPSARRMCLNLAAFFRRSLALGGKSTIPLDAELELAATYLSIESERFGERLRVRLDIDPAARGVPVPSLVLQPVIENAIHHGIAGLVEGGEVVLAARRDAATLRLTVENPCDPDRAAPSAEGMGLGNIRARLAAVYGDAAGLAVDETPGCYRVELTLPAVPPEEVR